MIDIAIEKDCPLSTQEIYEILDFSMQSAEDSGFINTFVFERCIYIYTAIILYPERKDEIVQLITQTPLVAWQTLVNDGTIELLQQTYPEIFDFIFECGEMWNEEYTNYVHSVRGILSVVENFSGSLLDDAKNQLFEAKSNERINEVIDFAKKWGINNTTTLTEDNLFED